MINNTCSVYSQAELDAIPDDYTGLIGIRFGTKDDPAVVRGSKKAVVFDKNCVAAHDDSFITAWGESTVMAYDNAKVLAYGASVVTAYGKSYVVVGGNGKVEGVFDNAQVVHSKFE